jgi:AP-4 complex subunit beta-1
VERDPKKRRDVIKKVIAYMTLGVDVSRLFTEMLMAIETRDLVIKKMVYLYMCLYAQSNPDLAIMCVNTLQRDCGNEDPMVRGLALRSLCSLRLPSTVEYIRSAKTYTVSRTLLVFSCDFHSNSVKWHCTGVNYMLC